jgi:ATP-dependent DNA helicase RecQ
MQQALDILKKYWQHDTFREPQEEIIRAVLEGKDTFALMPTGGGKSICFQIPALMQDGICLVISPLVALMKDQVQNLQRRNIKAIALTGGIAADEVSNLLDNCRFGNYKFLYISPERLQSEWVVERIKELPVNLVAVDEAHCVSQWGHDFRPAYLIITQLGLQKPVVFKKSFARENIAYMVLETEDKLHRIQQVLKKNPESSIIYVRNRKSCHDVSQQLQSLGFKATYYHGGLTTREKAANMQLWLENKVQVIVATNAFGMGIDKPDVRTVIHIQLPENIENYYQEAGRAGRDGKKSYAILLVNTSDTAIARNQFLDVLPDRQFLKDIYKKLNNHLQIAYGEGMDTEFPFNFNNFCRHYKLPALKTHNTLEFMDRQGILTLSKEFSEKITIQFLIPSREVMRYISLNPADEEMMLAIVRNYAGIFDIETAVNTTLITKKASATEQELTDLLQRLRHKDIISYRSAGNDSTIVFNEVREDDHTINRVAKFLEKQNDIKVKQFEAIIGYATNTTKCKSRLILDYFNEGETTDCGICTYCITKNRQLRSPIDNATAILKTLEDRAMGSRDLEESLNLTAQETVLALQLLLDNNRIKLTNNNLYSPI